MGNLLVAISSLHVLSHGPDRVCEVKRRSPVFRTLVIAISGDDFADRPTAKVLDEAMAFAPNAGVLNSSGENWREQRRASIMILRDFGMGKNLMEERVRSSIADYIDHLRSIADKDNVEMGWPIQVMVANIINETLFGYRYTHEDCQPLMRYVENTKKFFDSLAYSKGLFLGLMFPMLTELPLTRWHTFGKFKDAMEKINSYVVANVNRVMKDYSIEDEPTNFVHAYKQKMSDNEFLDPSKERLRREVHAVVGKERAVPMADQSNMPYSRACVLELQRFANILVANVQRYTTRDTEIRGCKIPKGSWVNADIHYLMASDPLFVNPEKFRPERYLMEDGRTLRKDLIERTVPFSIGKRACAGEGLARVELFLGLTSTFQHFKISPSAGQEIDLTPLPSTILQPKPQTLKIEPLVHLVANLMPEYFVSSSLQYLIDCFVISIFTVSTVLSVLTFYCLFKLRISRHLTMRNCLIYIQGLVVLLIGQVGVSIVMCMVHRHQSIMLPGNSLKFDKILVLATIFVLTIVFHIIHELRSESRSRAASSRMLKSFAILTVQLSAPFLFIIVPASTITIGILMDETVSFEVSIASYYVMHFHSFAHSAFILALTPAYRGFVIEKARLILHTVATVSQFVHIRVHPSQSTTNTRHPTTVC
ncbi:hypothetical protein PRIPAC_81741 [Pristionchus pacificus]|uniref:G protein-coupled receptor n=1 Tax=Pristionchus pacificus TaxID=54126 RepID=A0A2A6CJ10_PRIPA|nr:hypothetical protein PRIPAC_81741 [Pristionchus pacificus]|eukprot:PDM78214.1 G protein-coupled receptor [Pristionchus pacificus]